MTPSTNGVASNRCAGASFHRFSFNGADSAVDTIFLQGDSHHHKKKKEKPKTQSGCLSCHINLEPKVHVI
jgi:hypothetical protein